MPDSRSLRHALTAASAGALSLLTATIGYAAQGDSVAVTIYSSAQPGAIPPELYRPLPGSGVPNAMAVPGYAMVRQDRTVDLKAGRSTLRFTDVAALIDPTTVTFTSLTDPRTRVIEQSFQFDLVSTDKLLLKYLDREITVEQAVGNQATTITGTLLSSADGLVLRANDGTIHALRNYAAVRFPDLPGGLNTLPTLVWDLHAPRGGEHRTRVTYQTGGITWWADYNLILDEGKDLDSGTVDVAAWVSIINQSGASYPDARLKLIAGDVHRVEPEQEPLLRARAMELASADAAAPGFEQKEFFEFHLYTLGRPTTLPNNSTKQIELFEEARKVPARRKLVYDGLAAPRRYTLTANTNKEFGVSSNTKVDVYLEFRNAKQHGLGIPLPAGRIRVSKLDTDGSLEFIGEDRIDHTPKDEEIRIKLGSAFDVVGERRQVDYALDTRGHWLEEEFEIKLRNHKDHPVEVIVQENLFRWSNWTILSKTHEFTKEDSRTIHFPVKVPKDGEATLRYRVRYTW